MQAHDGSGKKLAGKRKDRVANDTSEHGTTGKHGWSLVKSRVAHGGIGDASSPPAHGFFSQLASAAESALADVGFGAGGIAALLPGYALAEVLVAYLYLWLLPLQAGFEIAEDVRFSGLYAFGYALDVLVLLARTRVCAKLWALKHQAKKGLTMSQVAQLAAQRADADSAWRLSLLGLLALLPYELPLWGTSAQHHIPRVRLTRLLFAVPRQHASMTRLERSQALSFTASRSFRVLHVFFWVTHVLGCVLHYFTTLAQAEHYAAAPWHEAGGESFTKNDSLVPQVLRSHYWSMMTLTTTGHVDIINSDGAGNGKDWEVSQLVSIP